MLVEYFSVNLVPIPGYLSGTQYPWVSVPLPHWSHLGSFQSLVQASFTVIPTVLVSLYIYEEGEDELGEVCEEGEEGED